MSFVRAPAAAGSFYPEEPDALAETVDRLLAAARPRATEAGLRALVVPHAGYIYSGAVAASAFACLPPAAAPRVALLGPSHFVPLHGLAVSSADAWRTPLGDVPVDDSLRAVALSAGARANDAPHELDHALEVEIPFLQRRLGAGLRIVPVAVGAGTDEAAKLVAALAEAALVLVSSDLSHYLDDLHARERDRRTAEAVLALDDAALGDGDACGAHALRGLLAHARRSGWKAALLEHRTSADAGGDRRRVVGYAAFAFTMLM